jgi:hypothetical protein
MTTVSPPSLVTATQEYVVYLMIYKRVQAVKIGEDIMKKSVK